MVKVTPRPIKKDWSCTECPEKGDTIVGQREHIEEFHMDGIIDKIFDFLFGWKL